ncbi:hypothetical protein TWF694_008158 [Orbilia ellipsospora]|uniref:Uncharacterized protein n=1 Tax=Orbilia ellipsospora TaxID=2528407 RepID=A0AAV9XLX5_9PEZI
MQFTTISVVLLGLATTALAAPLEGSRQFDGHKAGDFSFPSGDSAEIGLQTRRVTEPKMPLVHADRRRFLRLPQIKDVLENAKELKEEREREEQEKQKAAQ